MPGPLGRPSGCLRYIDQVELRQAIEKQLNKIELANSFTRAVAVGNPRGIEYAEKEAQEIAEGCNRLIRNSIICWNYLYLTRQFEAARTPEARENILKMIALHSPQTWGIPTCLASTILQTRSFRTTPASCPPNPPPVSSRKIGSRQNGENTNLSMQNENPYGGIGTYVGLGPFLHEMCWYPKMVKTGMS